jgi:glycosyltransferase involved in cell wall biosynthesis
MKSVCMLLQNHYEFDIRVRRKAEALAGAGYSVDVFALRGPDGRKAYTLDGINIYTISLGKRRGSLARYAFEYAAFLLWALVRVTIQNTRRRYALIEVNTLPDFLIFAAVFAKWMGAKLILDMHEITPEFYMSKYGITENTRLVRLLKYVEKISFNFADHVITINEPIRDLLVGRGLPRTKTTVIMNSADESRFAARPGLPPAADAAAVQGTFVMMYHGTLTRIYGLDIALEAFALAHKEMPGAVFCILGDGPEAGRLETLARERGLASKVRLVGRVSPDDVPAWLSRCDVGVLPIRSDVFLEFASPNKLPEYIIMGRAVIVSSLKAIRYYFTENALAYVEPNNPADLARQMLRVYQDPGLRARLAAKAREEYAAIAWSVMKERYLALVRCLLGIQAEALEQPRSSAASCFH